MALLVASSQRLLATPAKPSRSHQTCPAAAVAAHAGPSSSYSRRVLEFAPTCPLVRPRGRKIVCRSTADSVCIVPVVKIDNIHDPFATLVSVEMGEEVSDFLETIMALKNLGLNIKRAKISDSKAATNKFYLTESSTSEKIVKSARLEEIRMTVITSLMARIPDNCEAFTVRTRAVDAEAKALGIRGPGMPGRSVVPTNIDVEEADNGSCSVLKISTADRPGLLVDIVRVLKDVNLNVVSAEVDTVGNEAQDEFFVTYRGEPLSTPMIMLVTNALQYYLSLGEVATNESY